MIYVRVGGENNGGGDERAVSGTMVVIQEVCVAIYASPRSSTRQAADHRDAQFWLQFCIHCVAYNFFYFT